MRDELDLEMESVKREMAAIIRRWKYKAELAADGSGDVVITVRIPAPLRGEHDPSSLGDRAGIDACRLWNGVTSGHVANMVECSMSDGMKAAAIKGMLVNVVKTVNEATAQVAEAYPCN